MGRFGWHLKPIARLQRAGRLTFYGKIKATFEDIAGLYSRMRVPRDRHSRFYFSFHNYRHIARCWTVHLRQNLSRDARGCCSGRRALRRRVCRNQPGEPANRAGCKTRKASSRQHHDLPSLSGSPASGLLQRHLNQFGIGRAIAPERFKCAKGRGLQGALAAGRLRPTSLQWR